MSKRLLFKNKIVRFYEEDIWGIFFKKQQRRDYFLKKYIYVFFLARFIKELKKRRRLRKSFKLLINKSLYINLKLKKKKYKFFLKKKKWKQQKRNYFNNSKVINYKNNNINTLQNKKNLYFAYIPFNFKNNKKQLKNILFLQHNKRAKEQILFLLYHFKNYIKFKRKLSNIIQIKNIINIKNKKNKFNNKKLFLYFIRLNFNNNKFNLTYDFINFYFLYINLKYNSVFNLLKKEIKNIYNVKNNILIDLKLKYIKQIKINKFIWNIFYFKYLKLNLKGKQLYFNYLLSNNNNILNFKNVNIVLDILKINKIFNFNDNNLIYFKIISSSFLKNINILLYIKNILIINNFLLNDSNFLYTQLNKINNNNLINFFNINNINVSNFIYKLKLLFFLVYFEYIKQYQYYFLISKNILFSFQEYNKNILKKFLALRLRPFIKIKKRKQGALIFCLSTLLNFTRWLKRKIKRFIFKIRNFYYYKYNNFEDNDSIFAGNKFDITKIDLSFIKTDKDRKNNFVLLTALENLKNNKNKPKLYVTLSTIITKPSITFSKTEYLLSFYASTKLYKFFKKLKVNYIKTMLLKKEDIVKQLPYQQITAENKDTLVLYSKYLNNRIDNITRKERFYSVKKKRTALQRMFTLNLVPIVKYVKKKKAFNSFYTYKMSKVWKIRKFYGCLTDHEFKRICLKALKFQGDVLIRFLILLESRIDTLLFRSGFVSSIFEARQFINHSLVLVNNRVIDKRSYILKPNEMLSISIKKLNYLIDTLIQRINNENILFRPPVYLEVNYKYYLVSFLYDVINVNNIPYNFNIKGNDLNTILYYYY